MIPTDTLKLRLTRRREFRRVAKPAVIISACNQHTHMNPCLSPCILLCAYLNLYHTHVFRYVNIRNLHCVPQIRFPTGT